MWNANAHDEPIRAYRFQLKLYPRDVDVDISVNQPTIQPTTGETTERSLLVHSSYVLPIWLTLLNAAEMQMQIVVLDHHHHQSHRCRCRRRHFRIANNVH